MVPLPAIAATAFVIQILLLMTQLVVFVLSAVRYPEPVTAMKLGEIEEVDGAEEMFATFMGLAKKRMLSDRKVLVTVLPVTG
jgi:hypothetical protein